MRSLARFAVLFALLLAPTALANAFPVKLSHKYGETVIEKAPERIVSLGYNDQDALYALGAKPLAVRYWFGDAPHAIMPWAEATAAGAAPEVLNMPELNLEAILKFNPDFISAQYEGLSENDYRSLSKIAPTLAQSSAYIDYGTPWQVQTQRAGNALGKQKQAAALIRRVENRFSHAAKAHPEFSGKKIIVAFAKQDGGYFVHASSDLRSRAFTELGFVIPAVVDQLAGESFYVTLSEERYDLLDQDILVVLDDTGTTKEDLQASLENDEILRHLQVVQEQRVVYITGAAADALSWSTVLSLPYALEQFLPDLVAATTKVR